MCQTVVDGECTGCFIGRVFDPETKSCQKKGVDWCKEYADGVLSSAGSSRGSTPRASEITAATSSNTASRRCRGTTATGDTAMPACRATTPTPRSAGRTPTTAWSTGGGTSSAPSARQRKASARTPTNLTFARSATTSVVSTPSKEQPAIPLSARRNYTARHTTPTRSSALSVITSTRRTATTSGAAPWTSGRSTAALPRRLPPVRASVSSATSTIS